MKKVLTMMMMGLLVVTVSHAQQKWTLRQCIEHALQNNISLQKTRLAKRSATEDLRQSQAALLPSL